MSLAQIMKSLGLLRIFLIASLSALFISYLGIWVRFINDPVERTGSDFIGFYSVGRIAATEGMARVYDPLLQQSVQEKVVGFQLAPGQVLLNQHLPYLIPILQAISNSDYVASFYKWIAMMAVLYIVSILLLGRFLQKTHLDRGPTLFLSAGAFLFYPLFFSFLNGQDSALLVLGTAIWFLSLLSGKEWIAGLGLSLATVRPHIVILLAVPLFFGYRKAFWGFTFGSAVLALISIWILGPRGTLEFIDILLISAEGSWYGLNEHAMFNFIGLLLRLFPGISTDAVHIIGWIVYGMTFVGLCIFWGRNKDLQDGRIGQTVVLALLTAPHLHFHDLTLLLIPLYDFIRLHGEREKLKPLIAVIPVAISLLFLASNASPVLQYTTPYLLMLALAIHPYLLKPTVPSTIQNRS